MKRKEKKKEKWNHNPPFDKNVQWTPVGDVFHNDSPKVFCVPMVWELFTPTLSHREKESERSGSN